MEFMILGCTILILIALCEISRQLKRIADKMNGINEGIKGIIKA
jgi:hypothetical protein